MPGAKEFGELVGAPWWPQIHSLRCQGEMSQAAINAIVKSGCAARLRSVRLNYATGGKHGPLRWLDPENLPSLSSLVMNQGFSPELPIDEVAKQLATGKYSALRHLALNGAPLGDAAAKAIAENPTLRLTTLELAHNQLTEEGMRALIEAPHLEGLRRLRLSGNAPGKKLARLLRDPNVLPDLVNLDLPLVNDGPAYKQLREARPALFY
jgi:hypothetical protein